MFVMKGTPVTFSRSPQPRTDKLGPTISPDTCSLPFHIYALSSAAVTSVMLWVAETTDVSFASFWRLGSLISRCWLIQFLVRALSLSGPHMAERERERALVSPPFFYKNSNMIVGSSQPPSVNASLEGKTTSSDNSRASGIQ